MTIKELVDLTGISETEIEAYIRCGFIGSKLDGQTSFTTCDAKKIGLIRRLEQFELTEQEIETFFALCQKGDAQRAAQICKVCPQRLGTFARKYVRSGICACGNRCACGIHFRVRFADEIIAIKIGYARYRPFVRRGGIQHEHHAEQLQKDDARRSL